MIPSTTCGNGGFNRPSVRLSRTLHTGDHVTDAAAAPTPAAADAAVSPLLAARGAFGGVLMGLANLVPGISGGTMLLAAGVYPEFVGAIAEFTTLRFRLRSVVVFASIAGCAALAILLGAGTVKDLVVEHRWAMYSTFIGLTLGGAPLVWRLGRPATRSFAVGAGAGFLVMVLMALTQASGAGPESSTVMLFVAGVAGASAMILPGVSGGYLLLLLGQYVPILAAVHMLKSGLLGDADAGQARDFALVLESMRVVIPVGVGVVTGIVGVSNLVRWLLDRFAQPTLGCLFGLLLGAVAGLWPFQQASPPDIGSVIRGTVVTQANLADVDPEHWPVAFFSPTGTQVALALGLMVAGFAATLLIDRIGSPAQDGEDAHA